MSLCIQSVAEADLNTIFAVSNRQLYIIILHSGELGENTMSRRNVRRKNKRRTRNRIIIVTSAIVILLAIILILSSIIKGCSKDDSLSKIPTGTVGTTAPAVQTATTADKSGGAADELSPTYFMTPNIKDDNTNGTLAYSIYVWNKTGYELFSSDNARAQNYAKTINGFAVNLTGRQHQGCLCGSFGQGDSD